jgi:hypothetical protein
VYMRATMLKMREWCEFITPKGLALMGSIFHLHISRSIERDDETAARQFFKIVPLRHQAPCGGYFKFIFRFNPAQEKCVPRCELTLGCACCILCCQFVSNK